jgi:hypothetical protein
VDGVDEAINASFELKKPRNVALLDILMNHHPHCRLLGLVMTPVCA